MPANQLPSFQRGVYPAEDFTAVKKYGLNMLVSSDDQVRAYIKKIMSQLDKWMVGGKISKLVIVITNKDTGEHVERWQFDVCSLSLSLFPIHPSIPQGLRLRLSYPADPFGKHRYKSSPSPKSLLQNHPLTPRQTKKMLPPRALPSPPKRPKRKSKLKSPPYSAKSPRP